MKKVVLSAMALAMGSFVMAQNSSEINQANATGGALVNVNQAGNGNKSNVEQIGVQSHTNGTVTTVKIKQQGQGNKSTVDQGDIWNNGSTSTGITIDVNQKGKENNSTKKSR